MHKDFRNQEQTDRQAGRQAGRHVGEIINVVESRAAAKNKVFHDCQIARSKVAVRSVPQLSCVGVDIDWLLVGSILDRRDRQVRRTALLLHCSWPKKKYNQHHRIVRLIAGGGRDISDLTMFVRLVRQDQNRMKATNVAMQWQDCRRFATLYP